MKSIFYVGGVTRVYRAALDYMRELDLEQWENPSDIKLPQIFHDEIEKTGTRGMSLNFAHQQPGPADMLYHSSRLDPDYEPVAVVRGAGNHGPEVELRNVCRRGEEIEFMGQGIEIDRFLIEEMRDSEGREVERANPGDRLGWSLQGTGRQFSVNSMFRRKKS